MPSHPRSYTHAVGGWRAPASAVLVTVVTASAWAQPLAWIRRSENGPSARYLHDMVYDSARGTTVLFGGAIGFTVCVSDTWEWGGAGWTQRPVPGPSARAGHAMAYDSARGFVVMFGGSNNSTYNGETWEWNGAAWTQRGVFGPAPMHLHAMAYDSGRGVTVLFGGSLGINASSGDTWEWDGSAWTRRPVSGPSPRYAHAMAYDSGRGVTVLFGGSVSGGWSAETWEWNGAGGGSWSLRTASGPPARAGHRMVFDAARGVTVLFGGSYATVNYSDTWEWHGAGAGSWMQLPVSGPSARLWHGMAHDAARAQTVLFGGTPAGGETWVLGAPCYANCDRSTTPPVLNIADFVCFQSRFAAGDPAANCDGNSQIPTLTIADFVCFQAAFAAGCP